MKKVDFEKTIYDLCKPLVIEKVAEYGKDEKAIFEGNEFTPYGTNYGYFTIFVQNWDGWSDRMVFEIRWNTTKSKIEIRNSHYFKA